jgi:hypothetical protein
MSITDSSTALATTYTEATVVAFNAGSLATVTDCVTEVQSKLKRGTLGTTSTPTLAEVQRWLARSKQELAEVKGFTWKRRYATVSTVTGQFRYALTPDFNGGIVRLRDTTNDRFIEFYSPDQFDSTYPNLSAETSGEPLFACIKGMEMWLAPPTAGAYTLELEYERSGADNTTTDFSWLPEIERFRCCDFAIAESFSSLHMWEESDRYMQKWMAGIGKAIRADGKRKWHSMNFQAQSWQQRYGTE